MQVPVADDLRMIRSQPSLTEHLVDLGPVSGGTAISSSASWELPKYTVTVTPKVYATSWFKASVEQLASVMAMPRGWDSYDGASTSFGTVQKAVKFLGQHLQASSVPPTVVPMSDGGLQLVWHERGVDVEVTIPHADEIEVYVHDLQTDDEYEGAPTEGHAVLSEAFQKLSA